MEAKIIAKDAASLRAILTDLDRLEAFLDESPKLIHANQRGYFTPDEDNQVRHALKAYAQHRQMLYGILTRYADTYFRGGPLRDRLREFMLGYAAGLILYTKSLRFVSAFDGIPLVRDKLNEADEKFGLEAGFFDNVMAGLTALEHFRLFSAANRWWIKHRRAIRELGLESDPDTGWLVPLVVRNQSAMRRHRDVIFKKRLRQEWRSILSLTLDPVYDLRYRAQATLGYTLANKHVQFLHTPGVGETALQELRACLQPGDVILVRVEGKLTSAVLPGFWAHVAIYVGTPAEVRALGIADEAYVSRNWDDLQAKEQGLGCILEAIAPKALINPLQAGLNVDHVLVIRPNLSADDRKAALVEAFGHIGKAYDFEFDFNVTSRIVCTELVYRAYHKRGPIEFPLIRRVGRYTLSGDDVMQQFMATRQQQPPPFQLVTLQLRHTDGITRTLPADQQELWLDRIHQGRFKEFKQELSPP